MQKPVLVVLAGGMGNRFGGLKQMESVDTRGQWIIDYSLYDARRAGFEQAVCVVAPGTEHYFTETIGARVRGKIELRFVAQPKEELPPGYTWPDKRVRPWGTGHAVLSAAPAVNGPFAVVNADDFYGADAFVRAYRFLSESAAGKSHAMVGYRLDDTLTDHGTVSRGVCETDGDRLLSVTERLKITKCKGGGMYREENASGAEPNKTANGGAKYDSTASGAVKYDDTANGGAKYDNTASGGNREVFLPGDTLVSMNLWVFGPGVMETARRYFADFLQENYAQNPLLGEFHLPVIPNRLMKEEQAAFTVLRANGKWLGVTYREDMPKVQAEIAELIKRGIYPEGLWG
jgi:hypothetical protein